jgi:hypothetical protein
VRLPGVYRGVAGKGEAFPRRRAKEEIRASGLVGSGPEKFRSPGETAKKSRSREAEEPRSREAEEPRSRAAGGASTSRARRGEGEWRDEARRGGGGEDEDALLTKAARGGRSLALRRR